MSIFKLLFGKKSEAEPAEPWVAPFDDDEDDQGKHIVRIMVGNQEMILLLTDSEFIRAADRARRQLDSMTIEDQERTMEDIDGIDNRD
jgi:hypothetical protein